MGGDDTTPGLATQPQPPKRRRHLKYRLFIMDNPDRPDSFANAFNGAINLCLIT
jgi:hypothetical protein